MHTLLCSGGGGIGTFWCHGTFCWLTNNWDLDTTSPKYIGEAIWLLGWSSVHKEHMLHLNFDDTPRFIVVVDLAYFGATGPFVG